MILVLGRLIALILVTILLLAFLGIFFIKSPWEILKEFHSFEIWFAVKLSVITSFIATVITIILAIPTAYYLARSKSSFGNFLKIFLDLPMAFPELLTGFLLLLFFGYILQLKNIPFSIYSVIIAQFFVSFPFALKVLYTAFISIDEKYEHISMSLGYSPTETFFKVILPLAKKGIIVAISIAFARAFGAFGAVLVFAGGIYLKTETLPIALYLNLSYGNFSRALAAGLLLILISLLTLALSSFLLKEKIKKRI
jgi:molybdate transport system permease protein